MTRVTIAELQLRIAELEGIERIAKMQSAQLARADKELTEARHVINMQAEALLNYAITARRV